MIAALTINDPTTALMLTYLEVDDLGRVRPRRTDLRRGHRRFHAGARLRKLLA